MAFIKHVGKHGDRRVAVLYRTVPDEEHMALVIYPDTLSVPFHDSVMRVIESAEGQQADTLSEVMHRSLLADGRPMLQTLHKEGKIKKIQTNQIVITPNASSHVRLDELNKIFDGMAAGGEAAKNMAKIDEGAGLVDPVEQRQNEAVVADTGADVITDESLAADMIAQSTQMANEAKALLAESDRLQKEAIQLNPALKPKRTVKKKVAKKKVAKK